MTKAYADFGLTETEIGILAARPEEARLLLPIGQGPPAVHAWISGPSALAFVGMSSPADQRFLDGIVAESAAARQYAELILRHRGLGAAADRSRRRGARQAGALPGREEETA